MTYNSYIIKYCIHQPCVSICGDIHGEHGLSFLIVFHMGGNRENFCLPDKIGTGWEIQLCGSGVMFMKDLYKSGLCIIYSKALFPACTLSIHMFAISQ